LGARSAVGTGSKQPLFFEATKFQKFVAADVRRRTRKSGGIRLLTSAAISSAELATVDSLRAPIAFPRIFGGLPVWRFLQMPIRF
jgi:hypothetical protein